MTAFEYITGTISQEQIEKLSKCGILAPNTAQAVTIYRWHISNGRSKKKTAEHFGMKPSTTAYWISIMNKQI